MGHPATKHWILNPWLERPILKQFFFGVEAAVFGGVVEGDVGVSAAVLDNESSGYFLVPAEGLLSGWRPVDGR